jgi:hypothetical protein
MSRKRLPADIKHKKVWSAVLPEQCISQDEIKLQPGGRLLAINTDL